VRNTGANGVNQRIAATRAHALHHQSLRRAAPFDLVLANILAGPLCALASNVTGALHRGGILVLSGILNPEAAGVIATYGARGLAIKEHRRIEGWSTLTFIKRC
jgi:ribosomal protein L11 methyltransferase